MHRPALTSARLALAVMLSAGTSALAQIPNQPPLRPQFQPPASTPIKPGTALVLRQSPAITEVRPGDGMQVEAIQNPDNVIGLGQLGGPASLVIRHLPPRGRVRLIYSPDNTGLSRFRAMPLAAGVFCTAKANNGTYERVPGTFDQVPSVHLIDAEGVARIDTRIDFSARAGYERTRDFAGPCQLQLALDVFAENDPVSTRYYLLSPPFKLPNPPKTVRLTETASASAIFDFRLNGEGLSVCSGGLPGLPVGVRTIDGDLAVTVRSGPAGTICRLVSPGIAATRSLEILNLDWEVTKTAPSGQTSKCCFGDECMARVKESTVLLPGHLPDESIDRYQTLNPDAVTRRILGAPAPALRDDERIIGFAHGWMACDATALSDHSVTLRLKSIELRTPHDFVLTDRVAP